MLLKYNGKPTEPWLTEFSQVQPNCRGTIGKGQYFSSIQFLHLSLATPTYTCILSWLAQLFLPPCRAQLPARDGTNDALKGFGSWRVICFIKPFDFVGGTTCFVKRNPSPPRPSFPLSCCTSPLCLFSVKKWSQNNYLYGQGRKKKLMRSKINEFLLGS